MYRAHEIGKFGENEAVEYLKQKGYKILERNFECRQGEIDIIALDKDELIFIEVKTRKSFLYGMPVEAVSEEKQKHLFKAIEYYLYKRNLQNEYIRVDVIEVYLYRSRYRINHIKQIK